MSQSECSEEWAYCDGGLGRRGEGRLKRIREVYLNKPHLDSVEGRPPHCSSRFTRKYVKI